MEEGEKKGVPLPLMRLPKRPTLLNTSYWLTLEHMSGEITLLPFREFFYVFLSRCFRKLSCVGQSDR